MTTVVTKQTRGHGDTETPRRRVPRPLIALGALLVIALALATMIGSNGTGMPLDPENAGPTGSRALIRTLARQNVPTTIVRSAAELRQAGIDAHTVVVVPAPNLASAQALDALRTASRPGRWVVVDPSDEALDALRIDASRGSGVAGTTQAQCHSDAVEEGDTLSGEATTFRGPTRAGACFPPEEPSTDLPEGTGEGAVLDLRGSMGTPPVLLLGSPTMLSNAQITRASHAAIALRTLGHADRVIWYMPEPTESEKPVGAPAVPPPAWVHPMQMLLLLTLLLLMLWRGRRLGRLVSEPLPVIVPADETTRARARLYRRVRDTGRVARTLQDAAATDLRRSLRLRSDADHATIATAVLRILPDVSREDVLHLLDATVTASELPDHARKLRHLRRKVRTT